MSGIYMYVNKINNKKYIGQSVNLLRRKREHKHRFLNESSKEYNSLIHRAFRKYGLDNFEYHVLERCSASDLNEREVFWIKYHDSFEKGYNQSEGGQYTITPHIMTEEMLEGIIEDLLAKEITQEKISIKYNVSQALVSQINTGENWYQEDLDYPIRKGSIKNVYVCLDCGVEITRHGIRCINCSHKEKRGERPDPFVLAEQIVKKGFEGVGRDHGISGNAIKKWCKSYGIPHLKRELVKWYQKEINKG